MRKKRGRLLGSDGQTLRQQESKTYTNIEGKTPSQNVDVEKWVNLRYRKTLSRNKQKAKAEHSK